MSADSVVKSVHQRLLNIRDQTGEQFNHLLMRYALERLWPILCPENTQ